IARLQARLVGGYYSPAHRNDTTVVLIDDDSLDPQKGAWPVPYRTHARWLRNIGLIHKPRAIFLDITFGRERDDPTLPELVSALCELRDAG
ncbi:CHASE2 domain-containing protein, partial [Salmonella enterica]|nr:CHASE2 domain-containing protein [Salmonella enterica]